jgi:hypothetical protein
VLRETDDCIGPIFGFMLHGRTLCKLNMEFGRLGGRKNCRSNLGHLANLNLTET